MRWKRPAGAGKTQPRCSESATRHCFTRCGSSTWIRRGRGSPRQRQGLKRIRQWEQETVDSSACNERCAGQAKPRKRYTQAGSLRYPGLRQEAESAVGRHRHSIQRRERGREKRSAECRVKWRASRSVERLGGTIYLCRSLFEFLRRRNQLPGRAIPATSRRADCTL